MNIWVLNVFRNVEFKTLIKITKKGELFLSYDMFLNRYSAIKMADRLVPIWNSGPVLPIWNL